MGIVGLSDIDSVEEGVPGKAVCFPRRTGSVENAGDFRPAREGWATVICVQWGTQPAPFPRRTIQDGKYAQNPKGMRHLIPGPPCKGLPPARKDNLVFVVNMFSSDRIHVCSWRPGPKGIGRNFPN